MIIEVFCGSARVTASLKELGLVESFGVDHEVDKAIATVKKLDLTDKEDQQKFQAMDEITFSGWHFLGAAMRYMFTG